MISKKQIKEFIKKEYKKRIGKEGISKLDNITKEFLFEIIRKASRRADISGRNTLKKEDFE